MDLNDSREIYANPIFNFKISIVGITRINEFSKIIIFAQQFFHQESFSLFLTPSATKFRSKNEGFWMQMNKSFKK